jgi:hypothetical protein
MKNIIIALLFFTLSGCSVVQPFIDRFNIAPFDNNEYALANRLRTTAIQAKPRCDVSVLPPFAIEDYINEMYDTALLLRNYSEYLPKNDQTIKPVGLVFQMVSDLKNRYEKESKINKTYCQLKIQSIIESSVSIQQAIGKRPR